MHITPPSRPYFVNLPLSWVRHDPQWLERFAQMGINPELGLDEIALSLPAAWHKETLARMNDMGFTRVSHLPFYLTGIAAAEPRAFQAAQDMLLQGAELAAFYGAGHMVGHPSFQPGDTLPECDPAWPEPSEAWLERSTRLWNQVLAASPARLFLENTSHDQSPMPVLQLLAQLPERAAMCLDIGHWHVFGKGVSRRNLRQWLELCAPHIGHLHLHDNRGDMDAHAGIGTGLIPFTEYFTLLRELRVRASVTLEPHTLEDFIQSATWLEQSEAFHAWLHAMRKD